jgi:hypothetical protein
VEVKEERSSGKGVVSIKYKKKKREMGRTSPGTLLPYPVAGETA